MRLNFLDWVVNRKATTGTKADGDQDRMSHVLSRASQ
jgi:hypothetical protein